MTNEIKDLQKKVKFVQLSDRTFISGAVQCSFPHLFEKHSNSDYPDMKPEYCITLLIPKDDPIVQPLATAIKATIKDQFKGKKVPSEWRNPMRDGDDADLDKYPEMEGCWTLKLNNKRDQPVVVDSSKNPILDEQEVYPGSVVRAKFEIFGYSKQGKGVGCSLRLVQKIADAEPFGGMSAPEKAEDLPDMDLPETVKKSADPFDDFE